MLFKEHHFELVLLANIVPGNILKFTEVHFSIEIACLETVTPVCRTDLKNQNCKWIKHLCGITG